MKEISKKQKSMIEVYNHESRRPMSAGTLEKDILLTEALKAISEVLPKGYNLALCGNTALSKGYNVSEPNGKIDLKVMIPHAQKEDAMLATSQKLIVTALERAGFKPTRLKGADNSFSYGLPYKNNFPASFPYVAVTCENVTPFENLKLKNMKSIVDEHFDTGQYFEMPCVTLREILAEKTITLLARASADNDAHLMRHVYDLNQILQAIGRPDDHNFHAMFAHKIGSDVTTARATMRASLIDLQKNSDHAKKYENITRGLASTPVIPTYEKALSRIIPLAGDLIAGLEPNEQENQKNKTILRIR